MPIDEQIIKRLDRIEALLSQLVPETQLRIERKHSLLRAQGIDLVEYYKEISKQHTKTKRNKLFVNEKR